MALSGNRTPPYAGPFTVCAVRRAGPFDVRRPARAGALDRQCPFEAVENQSNCWFREDGTTSAVGVEGPLTVRSQKGTLAAAVAALGIIMVTTGSTRGSVTAGDLVQLLPD